MGRVAGHDEVGDRLSPAARPREDLFGEDLKQRRAADRSGREHPLGFVEAEPRPLPAGDENRADLAGPQQFLSRLMGLFPARRSSAVCGSRTIDDGGTARRARSTSELSGAFPFCRRVSTSAASRARSRTRSWSNSRFRTAGVKSLQRRRM